MIVARKMIYTHASTHRLATAELRIAVGTGEMLGLSSSNGAGESTTPRSFPALRNVALQAARY